MKEIYLTKKCKTCMYWHASDNMCTMIPCDCKYKIQKEEKKKYYLKNKERFQELGKQNYQENKQRYKDNSKKWKKTNIEKYRKLCREWEQKRVTEVYNELGNKCMKCGNENIRVLQIHHKFKKSKKNDWHKLDYDLTKLKLLCANCHVIIHLGDKKNG